MIEEYFAVQEFDSFAKGLAFQEQPSVERQRPAGSLALFEWLT
jgi:hypothetical protein